MGDIKARLRQIKHIALDMDGTIYTGRTLFPFTVDFLESLKRRGIGYTFLTNNPSKSVADYLLHLREMGVPASAEEMYTSSQATIDYIRFHHPTYKRLFMLGTPSMISEFKQAGFISTDDNPDDRPDAVVVAFDMSLTYPRLCRAAWWISQNIPYIATNPDKVCPTDQSIVLVDCGSICAGLEHATGRAPDVIIGKPASGMLDSLMERYQLQAHEIAMIGDRLYTDIRMATNTGALGVLVLSGETQKEDLANSSVRPDIVTQNLATFGKLLEESKT